MTIDTYVYCINCQHFKLTVDYPHCIFEDKCNIHDPEDSKLLSERPFYEENESVANIMDMINLFQVHGRLHKNIKGGDNSERPEQN